MKKILFIEGIDGAGKTEMAKGLSLELDGLGIPNYIVNKDFPIEYTLLYKLDKRKKFKSSPLAKFGYRITRLNIAINQIKADKEAVGIFESGILNVIAQSKVDGVYKWVIDIYVDDFLCSLKSIPYGTVLLNVNFETSSKRINKRSYKSKQDQKVLEENYFNRYNNFYLDGLSKEIFKESKIINANLDLESNIREVIDYLMS